MLTAAHCTEDFFDGRGKGLSSLYPLMRVQAHRFDLEKPCAAENCIELRPVKATWHPFFSRPTQGSSRWVVWDFAVWLLQPVPSNYTRPAIKPPALDTGSGAGTITTMLGHGLTTVIPGIWDDGTMGPKLQGINVSLITPARCAALDGIPMSPSFQCSMPVNLKGGQCRGDSGAPVVKTLQETRCYRQLEPNTNNCVTTQRDILVGLNSFGARDCGTGSIIIGTGQAKIAAAKSWIETVVCNWGGKCLKRTTTRKLVRTTTRKIIRTTSR